MNHVFSDSLTTEPNLSEHVLWIDSQKESGTRFSKFSLARPSLFCLLIVLCLIGVHCFNEHQERQFNVPQAGNQLTEEGDFLLSVYEMAPSLDGDSFLARSINGQLVEFSVLEPSIIEHPLPNRGGLRLVGGWNSKPCYLLGGTGAGYVVATVEHERFQKIHTPQNRDVTAACLTPDCRQVLIASIQETGIQTSDGTVEVKYLMDLLQPETGAVLSTIQLPDVAFDVCCEQNNGSCYIATKAGVYYWQPETAEMTLFSPQAIRAVDCSPEHGILITGNFEGDLCGLSLETGEELWGQNLGPSCTIKTVQISPTESRHVVSSGELKQAVIFDLVTGHEIACLRLNCPAVNSLYYSADGQKLYISCCNSRIEIWDLLNRKALREIEL